MAGKKFKSSELRELMARRLKAARMAYDENATAVAERLGFSKQALFGYEIGRTYPDELFLVRFNALTGCPLDWLFTGKITSEMPPQLIARITLLDPELMTLPMPRVARPGEPTSEPAPPGRPAPRDGGMGSPRRSPRAPATRRPKG